MIGAMEKLEFYLDKNTERLSALLSFIEVSIELLESEQDSIEFKKSKILPKVLWFLKEAKKENARVISEMEEEFDKLVSTEEQNISST